MGDGTTCLSAVVASVLLSGALPDEDGRGHRLRACEPGSGRAARAAPMSGKTRYLPLNDEAVRILKTWRTSDVNATGCVFPGGARTGRAVSIAMGVTASKIRPSASPALSCVPRGRRRVGGNQRGNVPLRFDGQMARAAVQ